MIDVFLSVFEVFEPSSKPLTMLCSILQIRKLKHKAVMKTLQGHPPRSRSWDLGRLASHQPVSLWSLGINHSLIGPPCDLAMTVKREESEMKFRHSSTGVGSIFL